jgi:hypothetical protein
MGEKRKTVGDGEEREMEKWRNGNNNKCSSNSIASYYVPSVFTSHPYRNSCPQGTSNIVSYYYEYNNNRYEYRECMPNIPDNVSDMYPYHSGMMYQMIPGGNSEYHSKKDSWLRKRFAYKCSTGGEMQVWTMGGDERHHRCVYSSDINWG